jgi:hypothetical protein
LGVRIGGIKGDFGGLFADGVGEGVFCAEKSGGTFEEEEEAEEDDEGEKRGGGGEDFVGGCEGDWEGGLPCWDGEEEKRGVGCCFDFVGGALG